MRTLLIVVTIVAVAAALLPYAGVSLLTALLVAVLILIKFVPLICLGTLAIYCRGYRQTLCLGAFAATLLQIMAGGDIFARFIGGYTLVGQIVVAAMQLATAIGCGFAAVATRRSLERRGWHLPSNPDDSV